MGESQQVAEVRRSGCVALPGPLTSENFRRLIAARDCEARSPAVTRPWQLSGVGRWVKPLKMGDFQGQHVNLPEGNIN